MCSLKYIVVILVISSVFSSANVVKKADLDLSTHSEINSDKISLLTPSKASEVKNVTIVGGSQNGNDSVIFTEGGKLKVSSENKTDTTFSPKPLLPPIEVSEVSKSSIQPRKGADINIPTSNNNNNAPIPVDNNKVNNTLTSTTNKTDVTYKVEEPVSQQTPVKNETVSPQTTKKPPHKPNLTMTFEEANPNSSLLFDIKNGSQKFASADKSSPSSPNIPKGQPGFVVPLVITMVALPILAFIGYQGIKRGKEAWKNRHYRRMDFLIDGMYND